MRFEISAADRSDSPSRQRTPSFDSPALAARNAPTRRMKLSAFAMTMVRACYAPRRRTLPGRASVIAASRITAAPLTKT